MRRIQASPRDNWRKRIEEIGFTYNGQEGDSPFWDESVCYEFTSAEVDDLEAATETLHALCLQAVDLLVREPARLSAFGIPESIRPYICTSWQRGDPYCMGRFDLAYDPPSGAIKMLEYNADTPTLVLETALVQWFWLQDCHPQQDQFNSLHEKLLARFIEIGRLLPADATLYFSGLPDSVEERQHSAYFMDLAGQAGIKGEYIALSHIGWRQDMPGVPGGFVDAFNQPIKFLQKLYPWEWLLKDSFGQYIARDQVGIIEPAWKMLLSNKAILPLLWEMFPDHPNLLPAYHEPGVFGGGDYIAKPLLGREGANMKLVRHGHPDITTGGTYGGDGYIYQQAVSLSVAADRYFLLGSWVVGDKAAGMIVREGDTPIIGADSRIVPHYFLPQAN